MVEVPVCNKYSRYFDNSKRLEELSNARCHLSWAVNDEGHALLPVDEHRTIALANIDEMNVN
jgi:hypothetical protein